MIFNEFIIPGSTGKRPGTDVGASVVSKRPKLESGAKKEEPGVKKEENAGVAKKLQKDIRRLTRKVSWITRVQGTWYNGNDYNMQNWNQVYRNWA